MSTQTWPLVSVVIATYNQAKYLGYSIESVLTQTYPRVELIVVDDGSTDTTPDVARRFGDRIRYVRQANAERGAARNRGVAESSGEFIAFLDSDDIWLAHKLDKEMNFLAHNPELGFVYSDREFIDGSGRYMGISRAPSHLGWVTEPLLQENFVCLSANLMRRDAIVQAGGFPEDRKISGCEDWVTWVRLSTVVQFGHLPEVTVLYRIHPANTMSNAPAMERAMEHAAQAIEDAAWLDAAARRCFPRMKANRALLNAIHYCSARDRRTTWRWLGRSVRHHPGVVLDPRYAYTIVRSLVPSLAQQLIPDALRRVSAHARRI